MTGSVKSGGQAGMGKEGLNAVMAELRQTVERALIEDFGVSYPPPSEFQVASAASAVSCAVADLLERHLGQRGHRRACKRD